MKKVILKSGTVLVVIFILSILYLRSGTTYYSNMGFGGPQITFRLGSFSYNYFSDIGKLNQAIGFTDWQNKKVKFSPISFLSSDIDSIPLFRKSFMEIKCGERHYIVSNEDLVEFKNWVQTEDATSQSEVRQPFYIQQGDETKNLGKCSY